MDEKQDLLDQLQQLTAELRGQFFQQLAPELPGLTAMHGRLLLMLAAKPGSTAQQLTELLRRDKAQITRLLNDLQQVALLQRQADPADGRRQLLVLSQQGEQLAAQLKAKKRQIAGKMLVGLTTGQQQQLTQLLAQMYQNLANS
ncbi:DNA-binding MarR family transcriptional regulator [Rheinheimera pacifica]|uniref:MarR family winged helix-turn-helix transcriptional regulator n=1 Tax=Rheinheimera pacifica TaxID=173990 RepID=UPI00285AB399|nr:MarR family transcriptional regulator [Rheinheimera pacifica]MDR6985476.1 DNA-binding MarR family transcriptional regulator [Rheinheimera pacifica]